MHAEYCAESHLTVSALLKQLPGLASDPLIQQQNYSRLCKAAGGTELINALSIQSYKLSSDEILVAVLEGYTGKAMHEMAKALVENEKILSAVSVIDSINKWMTLLVFSLSLIHFLRCFFCR